MLFNGLLYKGGGRLNGISVTQSQGTNRGFLVLAIFGGVGGKHSGLYFVNQSRRCMQLFRLRLDNQVSFGHLMDIRFNHGPFNLPNRTGVRSLRELGTFFVFS